MIVRRRPAAPAAPRTSLLGTMARTAVVVGTANAVTNKMNKPAAAAQPQAAPVVPAAAAGAATPATGGITAEKLELLKNLGELKAQGILSEEEFAAEKTKLLAS